MLLPYPTLYEYPIISSPPHSCGEKEIEDQGGQIACPKSSGLEAVELHTEPSRTPTPHDPVHLINGLCDTLFQSPNILSNCNLTDASSTHTKTIKPFRNLMVGPDPIKIPRGEGFLQNSIPIWWMKKLRLKRVSSLPVLLQSVFVREKDLNLGSTCQCSFHYTAHRKCAQMHAHTYEHITKNSMGAGGLLGRKEREIREKVERTRRGKANLQVF